jgi:ANTAR domain
MAVVERHSAGQGPVQLLSRSEEEQGQQAGSSEVVEQAKLVLSARYGFLPGEAFELLDGLARSQRCCVEEFAASVVRSGGCLDGDLRDDSGGSLISSPNGSGAASHAADLLIEVPPAQAASGLADSLADYGARSVIEEGTWLVVVDSCDACFARAPGALSRTKRWMAERSLPSASVRLYGKSYLLDGSTDGVSR